VREEERPTTLPLYEEKITEAVDRLSQSVVTVDTTKAKTARLSPFPRGGAGSGVIIKRQGYIITNNHVIEGASKVEIGLRDGRSFSGKVVGGDAQTDTALIRVEDYDLPEAQLGDSERLRVGQIAIAIGNTLGLPGGPTVSAGVISATGRPLPGADFIFEGLIQTDASINPGNSGGPLADLDGKVVGINTAMIPYAQGVGFALPINTVKRTVDQLIERGRVIRPWLGISGVTVNSAIARRYNLPTELGVMIVEVVPRSPAFDAGLRVGDILSRIGPLNITKMTDILVALSKLSIGDVVGILLVRSRGSYSTSIRLVQVPDQISH